MDNILAYGQQSIKNPTSLVSGNGGATKKVIFNAGVEASIEYIDPKKVYVNNISLLFSPYGLPFIPIELIGTNVGTLIQSMTWTKDRSNPGGMCSIEIAPDSKIIKNMVDILNKFSGNLYSKIWGELGVDLEDLFKPMTLCQLWINGYHVMTGTIRGCVRNAAVTNSDKTVSYTLSIDELGNIYQRDTMRLDTMMTDFQSLNIADSLTKALSTVAQIKFAPLNVGLSSLINAFLLSMTFEQGLTLSDGLPLSARLVATANPLGAIAKTSFALSMFENSTLFQLNGQTIWDYIKNFVPHPWMEIYTESGGRTMVTEPFGLPSVLFPGFNYLVARSAPYSNPLLGVVNPSHIAETFLYELSALQMLLYGDFIIITDDDIHQKSLGFDCSNQATMFRATYSNQGASNIGVSELDKPIVTVGPLNPFASGGVGTFGKKEMVESINCVQMFDAGTITDETVEILQAVAGVSGSGIISRPALSNLLAVWFRNQCRFREGSVVTRLLPYARPGMYCLYLPSMSGKKPENLRDIGIYYIDSLNHNYELQDNSATATTTLNLIRGVPLPTTVAQTALLLFDFEVLPPMSGLFDGELKTLQTAREALKARII